MALKMAPIKGRKTMSENYLEEEIDLEEEAEGEDAISDLAADGWAAKEQEVKAPGDSKIEKVKADDKAKDKPLTQTEQFLVENITAAIGRGQSNGEVRTLQRLIGVLSEHPSSIDRVMGEIRQNLQDSYRNVSWSQVTDPKGNTVLTLNLSCRFRGYYLETPSRTEGTEWVHYEGRNVNLSVGSNGVIRGFDSNPRGFGSGSYLGSEDPNVLLHVFSLYPLHTDGVPEDQFDRRNNRPRR
jgi:hypothetical protein